MKKLMMIAAVVMLNFAVSQLAVTDSSPNSDRQPAAATAVKSWSFNYKDLSKKPFSIKKEAGTYEEAYKSASRECYQQLTNGKYPGEEKGLDIIDICANPKI
jgi:hypothetical protein